MSHILIIEDDGAIREGLSDNLSYDGHEVSAVETAEAGWDLIQAHPPDLLILDVMLPRMSGFELCRRIRSSGSRLPILMLTARSEEIDRVTGLDLGADDYLTKPFGIMELMARVRALLRRTQPAAVEPDRLTLGDVTIDFLKFEIHRGSEPLSMSRKEFGLLRLLASRPGEVFTRDELLDSVWGSDAYPSSRTVDNHVASVRTKIEPDPHSPRFLLTVHGVGYRLVPGPA